ncbi:MAG: YdcF family protein [Parasporobacterium sp.]|nr:YdcF family protein [Parasporobacterium sp.]
MKKTGRMIIKTILIIAGVLLLLWCVYPVTIGVSFNYGNVTGIVLSVLMMIYGIWFAQINGFIAAAWKHTAGKIVEILLLIIAAGILVLAAATSIAMISGISKTAGPGDTVIVLGARLYGNSPSRTLMLRCDAAYRYLTDNPESVCIVSGGRGTDEVRSEASAMYDYLVGKGIDSERIYIEDQSRDTAENMEFSRRIIEENNLPSKVALATNGYHEYRALKYSDAAGLEAEALPAWTQWWMLPTGIIREMYGILELWFLKI